MSRAVFATLDHMGTLYKMTIRLNVMILSRSKKINQINQKEITMQKFYR